MTKDTTLRALRLAHRAALFACGPIGMTVVALTALAAASLARGDTGGWMIQAAVAIVGIRMLYHFTRGPQPVLVRQRWRRRLRAMLREEGWFLVAFAAACWLTEWPVNKATVAVFALLDILLQTGLIALTRAASRFFRRHLTNGRRALCSRRVLVIGTGPRGRQAADTVLDAPEIDAQLIGFLDYHRRGLWRYRDIPLIGHPDRLQELVMTGQVDAVFLALEPADLPRSRALISVAERMGVPVFVLPTLHDPTIARTHAVYIGGIPAFAYRSTPTERIPLLLKSIIDRVGAALLLVAVSPVMLAAALAIKMDSRGPILFKQKRCGLNGRLFPLYKFRTMVVDAERKKQLLQEQNEMTGPVFKIRRDPRVTRVGRILRKFSIDELPQLFNVIKGDMSLVGPRPPLPDEVSRFEPWQRRKLSVKPGVTCIWQVSGRNSIGFEEWMRMDLEYIDNWSLWLDAKLLARTIPAVLKGTGM